MALRQLEDMKMARKRHTADEIVSKLRQVDVLTAQGRSVAEAVRAIGVTEVSSATVGSAAANLDGEVFHSLAEAKVVIERGLATARQHQPPALGPGLQATGSRSGPMDGSPNHPDRGSKADHALIPALRNIDSPGL
jgi:putative transposase